MHACNTKITKKNGGLAIIAALLLIPTVAQAHADVSHLALSAQGFSSGFLHPLTGLDHLLAMLAVGVWAAQNTRTSRWLLPLVFPFMMLLGAVISLQLTSAAGAAGATGIDASIETGIALSVLILGGLIAFAIRLPALASAALIALFALLHGYAHGTDLASAASGIAYALGFLSCTLFLHLLGLLASLGVSGSLKQRLSRKLAKLTGAAIASCGLLFLYNLV
jgi:urease accessory protein